MKNKILWEPSDQQIQKSNLFLFQQKLNKRYTLKLQSFQQLHQWSIENAEQFWSEIWDFSEIIADKGSLRLENAENMLEAKWFSDSQINFAENLLRNRNNPEIADQTAIVFWGEDKVKRKLSNKDLYNQVSSTANFLKAQSVSHGDVVAGIVANVPEAIIFMLATTSLGAIWTSCSPDFGVQGVLDRFGQVKPKILVATEAYYYNGKTHNCLSKIEKISTQLDSLEHLVLIPYAELQAPKINTQTPVTQYPEIDHHFSTSKLHFTRLPFNAPLYIMYSSGTTGVPKCIVHGIGGTLIQHLKEHLLHVNVKPEDNIFYFTTCGWMMWNWLVSGMATGATLMLYDGSPFYPCGNILLDYAEQEDISIFGISAKYLDVLHNETFDFTQSHSFKQLKSILSTGSVLSPECFDYVYQHIKEDICLSSISGGTDIISCFALGSPILPVRRGELQCKGLGMSVEVWDETGKAVINQKGELVCTKPFPSMPIYFWNDKDNKKYHEAYFSSFENIWCHGDYVLETDNGGLVIYGRSDTVLNPGGVRIGTAEIYRQVEKLSEIKESIVIAQQWQDDVRIVLFVILSKNIKLDDTLIKKIKQQIRSNTSPRHVPAKILQVNDIPRTKSGKIVELAVRNIIHGERIKNIESLANPEALEEYKNRNELLTT